jgi:hypothetical protein
MAVLLLLTLNSIAAASSSSRSDCELSETRIPVSKTVDYSPKSDEKSELALLRERVERLDSLRIGDGLDSSVPRKDTTVSVDDRLDSDEAPVNAAELLAEKRLLERQQSDAQDTSAVKTLLPGVDTNSVRAFRKRMYRTDI